MMLHPPVTRAFPAAPAVASIFLALIMLPRGAAPAPSTAVAPVLKRVAGGVVAAVKLPVRAVTPGHEQGGPGPSAHGALGARGGGNK